MPEHSNSNHSPDIQDGLCAYVCRQSSLYDGLITLFITRWRTYLSACFLGSSWLCKYTSCVDPIPARPSHGHRKVDAGPASTTTKAPGPLEPSTHPKSLVDAPLDSESGGDYEGDENGEDAEGDSDDYIDPGDMFADD